MKLLPELVHCSWTHHCRSIGIQKANSMLKQATRHTIESETLKLSSFSAHIKESPDRASSCLIER